MQDSYQVNGGVDGCLDWSGNAAWAQSLQQPEFTPSGTTAGAAPPLAAGPTTLQAMLNLHNQRQNFTSQPPGPIIVGMRRLEAALFAAREGTGEVRDILLSAGFHPRLPGLTKIISKLSKGRACVKALEVFEALYDLGLTPDTAITNSAISACDKGGLWQRALQIFNSMGMMGVPRDIITYCATISVISWSKRWELALEVFKHMQSARVAPDAWVCSSFLGALERGGQWRLAESFFLRMCHITGLSLAHYKQYPVPYLDAVCCASPPQEDPGNPGRSTSLESMCSTDTAWSGPDAGTAPGSPITPSAAPGSTLPMLLTSSEPEAPRNGGLQRLTASAEDDLNALVADLSVSTSKEPLSIRTWPKAPDVGATALATPAAHRSRSSVPAMETLVESPPSSPREGRGAEEEAPAEVVPPSKLDVLATPVVEPNHVCCNVLLQAFARANPPEYVKALHLLEAMWEAGGNTQPDWVSYKIAIKACTSAKQFKAALQVYDAMVRRGIEASMQVLVALMSAAGEECYAAITRVWARLEASGLVVNTSFMNAYLAALDKQGLWEEAERNFCTMLSPDCCVEPSVATFNVMMRCYIHQGAFDKARGIFNKMCNMGLRPRLETFNSLIAAYAQQGQWFGAVATLRNISSAEMGMKPDITAFNTALSALAKAANKAGQDKGAIASQAAAILQKMRAGFGGAPPPDALTYALLCAIFEAAGHWGETVTTYELMRAAGVAPGQEVLRTLVSACIKGGLLKAAVAAINEAQQLSLRVDHATCQALLTACCETERQSGLLGLQCTSSGDATGPRTPDHVNFAMLPAPPTPPFRLGAQSEIGPPAFTTSNASSQALADSFPHGGGSSMFGGSAVLPPRAFSRDAAPRNSPLFQPAEQQPYGSSRHGLMDGGGLMPHSCA